MTAVTVGMRKLKITLNAEESARLLGQLESLCCSDPKTRRFLASLLRSVMPKTDFRLDCDRLYVEIYPSAYGGHIIYFTKAPLLKRFHKKTCPILTLILKSEDLCNITILTKKLRENEFLPHSSSLYKCNGEYSLLLKAPPEAFPYPLITEFADNVVCSDLAAAIVSEYGKLLIKDNAIEIISREL